MEIKVLGACCMKCEKLMQNAEAAVKAAGLNVKVEKVTDVQKIVSYGVVNMPALVINEKVISTGRVLTADEIGKHLAAAK